MSCSSQSTQFKIFNCVAAGEEFIECEWELCNFLHSPVISFFLTPNIFLSTLFSNILNSCSSLKVRNQVSQPYNTADNIILFYRYLKFLWKKDDTISSSQVNKNIYFRYLFCVKFLRECCLYFLTLLPDMSSCTFSKIGFQLLNFDFVLHPVNKIWSYILFSWGSPPNRCPYFFQEDFCTFLDGL